MFLQATVHDSEVRMRAWVELLDGRKREWKLR